MNVRAKFRLQSHVEHHWSRDSRHHEFIFRPEYDPNIPEDQRFAKASPSGELRIHVDNPAVVEQWHKQVGQQFYLDFVPVES